MFTAVQMGIIDLLMQAKGRSIDGSLRGGLTAEQIAAMVVPGGSGSSSDAVAMRLPERLELGGSRPAAGTSTAGSGGGNTALSAPMASLDGVRRLLAACVSIGLMTGSYDGIDGAQRAGQRQPLEPLGDTAELCMEEVQEREGRKLRFRLTPVAEKFLTSDSTTSLSGGHRATGKILQLWMLGVDLCRLRSASAIVMDQYGEAQCQCLRGF